MQYFDTESSDAMGAAVARAAKFTGKGVTVGVVDSGCDATHPDLADHVAHNVKLVGAEYANVPPDSSNTIVVPIEVGPYRNTDLGSGHGTHVAGIIAADGTTGPDHLGVAPDATLVCYAIGEVLFTTAVVSAYDHMLDQPDLWGIDVVNNSWGNMYQQFDPRNPVAVATKAVADAGRHRRVRGRQRRRRQRRERASTRSRSRRGSCRWRPRPSTTSGVTSRRTASATTTRRRSRSAPAATPPSPATASVLVHPDVTAPGVDISSTCDTAGAAVGPCPPGENTTASGTSMASPHVAGAAAVLLPGPPVDHARRRCAPALQVTATPVLGTDGEDGPAKALGFWQVGYGHVDLDAGAEAGPLGHLHQRPRGQAGGRRPAGARAASATTSHAATSGPTTPPG